MTTHFQPDRDFARQMDEQDGLATYKKEFYIPEQTLYLNGNSLGLLSSRAEQSLNRVLREWKQLGIKGWLQGDPPWFWFSEQLAHKLSAILGAKKHEVTVTSSTTINIHNLIASFFDPKAPKNKILMEELCFPTDLYAVKSQLKKAGLDPSTHLILAPSHDGHTINEEDIIKLLESKKQEIGVAFFSSVLFGSGQKLNVHRIAQQARHLGITIGFDLSHSIGVMPHDLHNSEVDFAMFCNYKWVSGGPGATAGLFIHEKHLPRTPALTGWWGHDKSTQFQMNPEFTPADGAGAFQLGTIDMLSAAPIEGALDLILEAGIENIRHKSLDMTAYLTYLIDALLKAYDVKILTPRDQESRGGHVTITHPEGGRINKALSQHRIICDYRPPNMIRIAPSPMYNTYQELHDTVLTLKGIMDDKRYQTFDADTTEVT